METLLRNYAVLNEIRDFIKLIWELIKKFDRVYTQRV